MSTLLLWVGIALVWGMVLVVLLSLLGANNSLTGRDDGDREDTP